MEEEDILVPRVDGNVLLDLCRQVQFIKLDFEELWRAICKNMFFKKLQIALHNSSKPLVIRLIILV